jgi:hypothetical protein
MKPPRKTVSGPAPTITSKRRPISDYSTGSDEWLGEVAHVQAYVDAGASRNMDPLCWGIDWFGAVPILCRATVRGKRLYCKNHLDQEGR